MKIILIYLFLISLNLFGQDYNHFTIDTVKNKKMLIGYCTKEAFQDTAFSNWFNENYSNYQPDNQILDELQNFLNNLKIKIVLGTWCSDSREFVPAFLKILDSIKFPEENLEMICVDRNKKGYQNEVDNLDINFVPTFIFYKNDKEIGRIIEIPNTTLENDFLEIVKNN
ncbi:MAG: thioredoxin family protein [Ignavibacterium sp.]|nr:thioredoxin family protein [Ignavibacterium sp.]MDW8375503.1 thioredoxin family protein [Ignavibacteriales bacterium]